MMDEAPAEIVVRFIRTDAYEDPMLASTAANVLDAGERKTLMRLRAAETRRDYVAAHALARRTISAIAGCEPGDIQFRLSPLGRPEIVAPSCARHIRFSLSHASGIAICVAGAACTPGADVESLRNVGPDRLSWPRVSALRAKEMHSALRPLARAPNTFYLSGL